MLATNGFDSLLAESPTASNGVSKCSLRIGVNLCPLSLGGGGMRQYVLQLLPWLLRLSPHRLLLFHGLSAQPSLASMLRRLTLSERSRVQPIFLNNQEQIFARAGEFDVLF